MSGPHWPRPQKGPRVFNFHFPELKSSSVNVDRPKWGPRLDKVDHGERGHSLVDLPWVHGACLYPIWPDGLITSLDY